MQPQALTTVSILWVINGNISRKKSVCVQQACVEKSTDLSALPELVELFNNRASGQRIRLLIGHMRMK